MNKHINVEYFLEMAEHVAEASTCRVKVGCVLVRHNYVLGMGYVGSVSGDKHCEDSQCLLVQASHKPTPSCIRTIHAEQNAVLKCMTRGNEHDGWLESYSTHKPCLVCLKLMLQIGVTTFYFRHNYQDALRDKFVEGCMSHINFFCMGGD